MTRKLGILFIFIANIFILAHAVAPHYYHNGEIVAIACGHHHDNHHDNHHHSDSSSSGHDSSHDEDCAIHNGMSNNILRNHRATPDLSPLLTDSLFTLPQQLAPEPVDPVIIAVFSVSDTFKIPDGWRSDISLRGPPSSQLS